MAKTKRFMKGGDILPNTYPFASQPVNDNSVNIGEKQEPLGEVMNTQEPVTMYRRGGKVKKYADGGKADYAIPDARARAALEKVKRDKEQDDMGKAYNRSLRSEGMESPASAPMKPADKKPKAMAKGGCAKRYADGGVAEGENVNIDDDTRARAMAAIRRRMAGEDEEAPVAKPRAAKAAPGPSGRPRENVAPSGRSAASVLRKEEDKPKASTRYPTAAERGAQIRQSVADVESENVRKRNERAESGKSSLSDMMKGLKRRFGTQAMREEEGMKKGGKVNCYAKGGSVKGAGIAQRGVKKCKMV